MSISWFTKMGLKLLSKVDAGRRELNDALIVLSLLEYERRSA